MSAELRLNLSAADFSCIFYSLGWLSDALERGETSKAADCLTWIKREFCTEKKDEIPYCYITKHSARAQDA
ncbi:hypothetical protein AGMMS50276_31450 [Synergistales bacterium]|nr:hypothetical protein AGMMS50276_31450 [Synergistales bacterium]